MVQSVSSTFRWQHEQRGRPAGQPGCGGGGEPRVHGQPAWQAEHWRHPATVQAPRGRSTPYGENLDKNVVKKAYSSNSTSMEATLKKNYNLVTET